MLDNDRTVKIAKFVKEAKREVTLAEIEQHVGRNPAWPEGGAVDLDSVFNVTSVNFLEEKGYIRKGLKGGYVFNDSILDKMVQGT